MIRTYRARMVVLSKPLTGHFLNCAIPPTEIHDSRDEVSRLLVAPEIMAAFITLSSGAEIQARYDRCEFVAGSMVDALELHLCEFCGQSFETGQALGSHRAIVHKPEAVVPKDAPAESMRVDLRGVPQGKGRGR